MPRIEDTLNIDLSNYTSVPPSPPPPESMPHSGLMPTRNPLMRFAAPYLPGTFPSTDNLTAYHIGGKAPQYRMPVPAQAPAQGSGSTSTSSVVITSSSSSTTTNNPAIAQTASLTTA